MSFPFREFFSFRFIFYQMLKKVCFSFLNFVPDNLLDNTKAWNGLSENIKMGILT